MWRQLVVEGGLDNSTSMTGQTPLLLDFEEKIPLPRNLKGENLRRREF
jgi:hypothetical protein